jgi:peptidoglycan/xylan/chitin deacetylase (PgdA/CDA1 family)
MIIFALMTFVTPHYDKPKKNSLLNYFQKDFYFVKTPWWLKKLYPDYVWDIKSNEKKLYLSFDDGPHPTITAFVLKCLAEHNAKATFFCIGKNVEQHPEVFQQIIDAGHSVGNHTQQHLNGWKSGDEEYLRDIQEASGHIKSNLFRPPYGRIKKSQSRLLKQASSDTKIIMWNILSGDWDEKLKPERCLERVLKKTGQGNIIVFHDTDKAFARLEFCLPRLLEHFTKQGYLFERIPG